MKEKPKNYQKNRKLKEQNSRDQKRRDLKKKEHMRDYSDKRRRNSLIRRINLEEEKSHQTSKLKKTRTAMRVKIALILPRCNHRIVLISQWIVIKTLVISQLKFNQLLASMSRKQEKPMEPRWRNLIMCLSIILVN